MRCKLRFLPITLIGLLLVAGVGGCSYSYPFEFSGIIRDAAGNPLAGVKVVLNAENSHSSSFPVFTAADGSFKGTVKIRDIEFMRGKLPKWSLELSKVGYTSTTIDVSPKQAPQSSWETTNISTTGTLKK